MSIAKVIDASKVTGVAIVMGVERVINVALAIDYVQLIKINRSSACSTETTAN
jgi:hypothetical protein